MAKQINCGICAINGETIAMQLKDYYFKCIECGAELHVTDDGDDTFIRNWQQQQQHISRSFQPGTHVVGGGDAVGKSGVDKMKKKTTSRLNFELDSPRFY